MEFPKTNKIHQDLNKSFGENAKLLEEKLKEVNWRYFSKMYAIIFAAFLASLFLLIAVVRLALLIF